MAQRKKKKKQKKGFIATRIIEIAALRKNIYE